MTEELTFEPTQIGVRRGETVTFSVRNVSGEGHEAYIGTEEEQRLHKTDHSALSADEQAETTHQGFGVECGHLVSTFRNHGRLTAGDWTTLNVWPTR